MTLFFLFLVIVEKTYNSKIKAYYMTISELTIIMIVR